MILKFRDFLLCELYKQKEGRDLIKADEEGFTYMLSYFVNPTLSANLRKIERPLSV